MPNPAPLLHPLEAKFVKLALLRQMLNPSQVKGCQEIWQRRLAKGNASLNLEQVFMEQGLLTEDECEQLWEVIAQNSDTQVRGQIAERRDSKTQDSAPTSESHKETKPGALAPDPVPSQLAGYMITGSLGRGGMGAVYRARQLAMDRDVALKLLPPDLARNSKYIRRFIREARAAGLLNHASLVRVYDVGEADGRYYISMELVDGCTVKDVIRREGRVGIAESLRIIEQVAAALDCAHKSKIIHRDIKPDNIMIPKKGPVKLCDLGLAKVLEGGPMQDTDTHTQDGHTMGTPYYMSPEQARSAGKVDTRSDLFALGATWYHMVTGRVPFDGKTTWEILGKVTTEAPINPDLLEPLLPPPMSKLILKLMSKQPSERPPSAEFVRQAVEQMRRDIRDGQVFVYDDAPRHSGPSEAPIQAKPRKAWHWPVAAGAALLFAVSCFAGRIGAARRAPPPLDASLVQDPPPASHENTAANPGLTKPSPGISSEAPSPVRHGSAELELRLKELSQRLARTPEAWPEVLSILSFEAPRPEDPDEVRDLHATLLESVRQLRAAAASQDLERRREGARALADAGMYLRAAGLFTALHPLYAEAPGYTDACAREAAQLRGGARGAFEAQLKEVDGLLEAGLYELAAERLEMFEQELNQDRAPVADVRRVMLKAADDRLKNVLALNQREAASEEKHQKWVQAGLAEVHRLSASHDLNEAFKLCEERFDADRDMERRAYGAEMERLHCVIDLFKVVRRTIHNNPEQINEADFRKDQHPSGQVKDMDEHSLILSRPNIVATLRLADVSADQMRKLFTLVFNGGRNAPNDEPLGRIAYDLDGPRRADALLELMRRPKSEARVQVLLGKLAAARFYETQRFAEAALLKGERLCQQGFFEEAVEVAGVARAALAGPELAAPAGEVLTDPKLEARAIALLKVAYAGRAVSARSKHIRRILPHGVVELEEGPAELFSPTGDWHWDAAPTVQGDCLTFGPQALTAESVFSVVAPGQIEVEVQIPVQVRGALLLAAVPLDPNGAPLRNESVAVGLDAGSAGPQIFLELGGRAAPAWGKVAAAAGQRMRLWLRLGVDDLSWGVEERQLGARPAAGHARWALRLVAREDVQLFGLNVHGGLSYPRELIGRAKVAERRLAEALLKSDEAQEHALKELFAEFGDQPALASRMALALRDYCDNQLRVEEARYWQWRAYFECPPDQLPDAAKPAKDVLSSWLCRRYLLEWPVPDPRLLRSEDFRDPPVPQ